MHDYRLKVIFADGAGEVEMKKWLFSNKITGSIFEPLRDKAFFGEVFVDLGVVTWPNGADLAPDAMYDAIKREGCWVVE
jgi:hypothetical protein